MSKKGLLLLLLKHQHFSSVISLRGFIDIISGLFELVSKLATDGMGYDMSSTIGSPHMKDL